MQMTEQPAALSEGVDIASIEVAINRCNEVLGRVAVSVASDVGAAASTSSKVALSVDASEMATVYALMIHTKRHLWEFSELTKQQQEAFVRWRVRSVPVVAEE
ncbi:DUF3717 domain-containing protein [Trinickia mobilis]|uniref:DUF3717 domain-containing protein n=1 Tax=Trinickia mobilis TaxID=2816356 RepID=UPI001A8D6ABA|nr:DUF3717 domain-containing protein [Trinickia mobilis]